MAESGPDCFENYHTVNLLRPEREPIELKDFLTIFLSYEV